MQRAINESDYYVSQMVAVGNATVITYKPKHETEEQKKRNEAEILSALAEYGRALNSKEG